MISGNPGITENQKMVAVVAKGAGFSFFGNIFSRGITFVITVILTRFLGVTAFGFYSLGLVILSLASVLARFGLDIGALKYVATYLGINDKKRVKGTIIQSASLSLTFGILLGIVIYFFSGSIALFFQKPDLRPVIQIFAFGTPFFTLLLVLGAITRGFKTTKYESLGIKVIQPLVNLSLIFLFYFLGYHLLGMAWAYNIALISGILVLFYFIKKLFPEINFKKLTPKFETKKLLITSAPLMVVVVALSVVHWTDILMVGYFLSAEKVGIYRVAVQVAMLVAMFLVAFNSIFAPVISDLYHRKKKENLQSVFKTITRWGFYLGLLVFLIIIVSPNEILNIFGEAFSLGKSCLVVLSLGQLINIGVGSVGFMLMMTGREKLESLNTVGVLVLNIILNLFLIPRLGILGAAIATTASISIINIIRVVEIYFLLKIHPFNIKFLKGIEAGVLAVLLTFLLKNYLFLDLHYFINLILSSSLILIFFSIFLFLFKFESEDKFIFQKIKQKL